MEELVGRLMLSRTFIAVHADEALWDTWYYRDNIDFCNQNRAC